MIPELINSGLKILTFPVTSECRIIKIILSTIASRLREIAVIIISKNVINLASFDRIICLLK